MLIQAHLDKYYQQTLGESENESAHSPMSGYDFSWIWEELDLVKYRL